MSVVLRGEGLVRSFGHGSGSVRALDGVDIEVPAGHLVVVRGPSGSGKTTLLNLLGGLDRPDSGRVLLRRPAGDAADGTTGGPAVDPAGNPARESEDEHEQEAELSTMSEAELVDVRRRSIGFVFQSFGLLPVLSAAENVGVPLRLLRLPVAEREARVAELLERLGLTAHARQRPGELSGGQQQRVAVARALAARPRVLIADEPTGQLDSATGRSVMTLLREVVDGTVDRDGGGNGNDDGDGAGTGPAAAAAAGRVAAVVATHDTALADLADTVVELQDGRGREPAGSGAVGGAAP